MKQIILVTMIVSLVQAAAGYEMAGNKRAVARITLPEVSFTNAALADVARFISDASIEYDTGASESKPRGINIVLIADEATRSRPVNIHAYYINLLELISQICAQTDLKSRVEGTRTVILSTNDGPLVTRFYDVLPSLFTDSHPGGTDVTEFWSRLGIAFPEGASASHFPELGRLVVCNTAINIERMEGLLATLNVVPYQFEVDCQAISVPNPTAFEDAWGARTGSNVESIVSASNVLFRMTTIVSDGQLASNSVKALAQGDGVASVWPMALAEFRPSGSPDGRIIAVAFAVKMTRRLADGRFLEYAAASYVTVYNGDALVVWLHPTEAVYGGDSRVAIVLRVTQVGSASRLIRRSTGESRGDESP